MATPPPDAALRDWAIARYQSDPQVRSTCLQLQDEHGVDVVSLLALWWACAQGRHTDPGFAAWVTSTRDWSDDVVAPLRRARRAIPPGPLREQLATAEVAAEVDQLDQLAATAPPVGGSPAGAAELVAQALELLVARDDGMSARRLLGALAEAG